MSRQHSLEELYRLHEDAGEWAEASKILLKIMERDHGWGHEFYRALRTEPVRVYDANSLDAAEYVEEMSLGGRRYEERR